MATKIITDDYIFKSKVHFQNYVRFRRRELLLEELAQPNPAEPSGGTWHKFADPATGWKASKTTWATADDFDAGLEVTFSEVPAGAKAVRCVVRSDTINGIIYYRKSGDANISNTPNASQEYSTMLGIRFANDRTQTVLWLSSDYKVQFTVSHVDIDLYIASPIEYLL